MQTWHPAERVSTVPPVTGWGWLRVALRLPALAILLFGGLGIYFLCRALEYPFSGPRRPISAWLPYFCCGHALTVLGIGFRAEGRPMAHPGAQVANHSSWLDIYALYRRARIFFVAKADVDRWLGVGFLSRSVGTVFISRDPRRAQEQRATFEARLAVGDRLVFFPEGTSTDGTLVLPFKSTLFAAFFTEGLRERLWIQPVSICYQAPAGVESSFYGWFSDMTFVPHFLRILGARRQGRVILRYGAPLRVAEFADRKALSKAAEQAVREGVMDLRARYLGAE